VLIASHDLELIRRLEQPIMTLYQGRLIQNGLNQGKRAHEIG